MDTGEDKQSPRETEEADTQKREEEQDTKEDNKEPVSVKTDNVEEAKKDEKESETQMETNEEKTETKTGDEEVKMEVDGPKDLAGEQSERTGEGESRTDGNAEAGPHQEATGNLPAGPSGQVDSAGLGSESTGQELHPAGEIQRTDKSAPSDSLGASEIDKDKKAAEGNVDKKAAESMDVGGKVLGIVAKKPSLVIDELDISNALRNHTVYRKIPYKSRLEGLLESRSKQHIEETLKFQSEIGKYAKEQKMVEEKEKMLKVLKAKLSAGGDIKAVQGVVEGMKQQLEVRRARKPQVYRPPSQSNKAARDAKVKSVKEPLPSPAVASTSAMATVTAPSSKESTPVAVPASVKSEVPSSSSMASAQSEMLNVKKGQEPLSGKSTHLPAVKVPMTEAHPATSAVAQTDIARQTVKEDRTATDKTDQSVNIEPVVPSARIPLFEQTFGAKDEKLTNSKPTEQADLKTESVSDVQQPTSTQLAKTPSSYQDAYKEMLANTGVKLLSDEVSAEQPGSNQMQTAPDVQTGERRETKTLAQVGEVENARKSFEEKEHMMETSAKSLEITTDVPMKSDVITEDALQAESSEALPSQSEHDMSQEDKSEVTLTEPEPIKSVLSSDQLLQGETGEAPSLHVASDTSQDQQNKIDASVTDPEPMDQLPSETPSADKPEDLLSDALCQSLAPTMETDHSSQEIERTKDNLLHPEKQNFENMQHNHLDDASISKEKGDSVFMDSEHHESGLSQSGAGETSCDGERTKQSLPGTEVLGSMSSSSSDVGGSVSESVEENANSLGSNLSTSNNNSNIVPSGLLHSSEHNAVPQEPKCEELSSQENSNVQCVDNTSADVNTSTTHTSEQSEKPVTHEYVNCVDSSLSNETKENTNLAIDHNNVNEIVKDVMPPLQGETVKLSADQQEIINTKGIEAKAIVDTEEQKGDEMYFHSHDPSERTVKEHDVDVRLTSSVPEETELATIPKLDHVMDTDLDPISHSTGDEKPTRALSDNAVADKLPDSADINMMKTENVAVVSDTEQQSLKPVQECTVLESKQSVESTEAVPGPPAVAKIEEQENTMKTEAVAVPCDMKHQDEPLVNKPSDVGLTSVEGTKIAAGATVSDVSSTQSTGSVVKAEDVSSPAITSVDATSPQVASSKTEIETPSEPMEVQDTSVTRTNVSNERTSEQSDSNVESHMETETILPNDKVLSSLKVTGFEEKKVQVTSEIRQSKEIQSSESKVINAADMDNVQDVPATTISVVVTQKSETIMTTVTKTTTTTTTSTMISRELRDLLASNTVTTTKTTESLVSKIDTSVTQTMIQAEIIKLQSALKDELAAIPKQRRTNDRVRLEKGPKGRRSIKRLAKPLPICYMFSTRSRKRSILVLPQHNLRRLSRRGGNLEVEGYISNTKNVGDFWPYPCARPSFKICWRYRLQTVRSLSAVSLLLRTLWACIRWDDLNIKPPNNNGVTIINTEKERITSEIIDRRDVTPSGVKSQYLVRKMIVPKETSISTPGKITLTLFYTFISLH